MHNHAKHAINTWISYGAALLARYTSCFIYSTKTIQVHMFDFVFKMDPCTTNATITPNNTFERVKLLNDWNGNKIVMHD